MKNLIFSLALVTISLFSFAQELFKKNLAEVNQYSGIYVFFDCKPLREYEYITTMKKNCVAKSITDAFQKYAAMAKKEFPQCDGIIFHDMQMDFSKDRFDVIKFKEPK